MIDDEQLDMLIDGELSEAERREVLSQLDAEPDGWRRCALAFLEAQSWREEMQAIPREAVVQQAPIVPNSRSSWRRFHTVLAVATSFLLAFGLGLAIDDMLGGDSSLPSSMHVVEMPPSEETNVAEPPSVPVRDVAPELNVPFQYVAIPTQDPLSGESDSIRMPVVPRELLGDGWPYRLPSVLPDGVVRSLHQRGHDVVQQRRLVPMQAEDGRSIVFPVDEVELVPVANRGYQ